MIQIFKNTADNKKIMRKPKLAEIVLLTGAILCSLGIRSWFTRDRVYIDLTAQQRIPFDQLKGRKEVTVNKGGSVFVFDTAHDKDGIRQYRYFVNDILLSEYGGVKARNGRYYSNITGLSGWELRTTEQGFRVGENSIKYEIEDSQGNIVSDTARVYLQE